MKGFRESAKINETAVLRRITAFLFAVLLSFSLYACTLPAADVFEEGRRPDSPVVTAGVNSTGVPAENTFPQALLDPENGELPSFSGDPYIAVADNIPAFSEEDYTTDSYEFYSELDALARCGLAMACIGEDLMPTEPRGNISQVKPTGWHSVQYDIVDGNYLYNRCHLIGFQLTGENANEKNLITGTRYLNVEGMLPFENMVADYIKETGNHVLYRVTPIFEGNNLVASGVQIEGYSVEDDGDGICFNIYAYNAQPGIEIDYATGESRLAGAGTPVKTPTPAPTHTPAPTDTPAPETKEPDSGTTYILNTGTKKFHYPHCSSVDQMNEENKAEYTGNREDIIAQGYSPCGRCNP